MKTILKYYLLPFSVLIILNVLLFIFINDFNKSTTNKIKAVETSGAFLSHVYKASNSLHDYILTEEQVDSVRYVRSLEDLEKSKNAIIQSYSDEPVQTDSLQVLVEKYILGLEGLKRTMREGSGDALNEFLLIEKESQQTQERIHSLLNRLNKNESASLILGVQRSDRLFSYLFIIYLGVFIGMLLIAYVFFIRPLGRLRKEIKKLSTGSYTQIDIDRDDEIGYLVQAFNETSASLKRSEEKLRNTNNKLEATNKELEAFAYSVSHDLRSPLRSISGFSEALVNNYSDDLSDKAQDYLNRVHKAAIKMGELIDDILKLSRVSRKEINKTDVNITEMVRELIQLTTTEDERLRYDFIVEEDLHVLADKGMVKVILLNLLSNAIKFSTGTTDPIVEIGGVKKKHNTYIYVRDNGIGMDMKYSEKVFGAFQRLHAESEFEGTGIGLASVKRIVNKHGGEIFIESELGNGTTVFFNLDKEN